jgi:anaerobic ribonucleoside-triphosphate reductase
MKKRKYLRTCQECGKKDETVSVRACGYSEEINGTTVMETICDACEHEHLMDI